jgi:hypothetical protein
VDTILDLRAKLREGGAPVESADPEARRAR